MTSFAFILGCVALFIATGAGSVARQIMVTAVIGKMLASTGLAIFIIPALYVIVEHVASLSKRGAHTPADVAEPHPVEAD